MSTEVKLAKQAIHDKIESQLKTAEAMLDTLKAQAASAKANVELKAIAELMTRNQAIQQKLHELKKSDGGQFEQVKADVKARITELEKTMKEIESRVNGK